MFVIAKILHVYPVACLVVSACHFPDLDCFGSGRKEAVLGPVGGFRY